MHLRLANSRFYFLCARMNHFEAHLEDSLRGVDSKVLRMAIWLKNFDEKKGEMANVMLLFFLHGMSSDILVFKVPVFASDFECWIEVNEYYQ